jgi:hypothetical protein
LDSILADNDMRALSPSEVLYLASIQNASYYPGERVPELFAIAILANGDAGLVRLQERSVEGLGRFFGDRDLHLIAEGMDGAWPEPFWVPPNLEHEMMTLVRKWAGYRRVKDLVADFMPTNPPVPFDPSQSLLGIIEGWARRRA